MSINNKKNEKYNQKLLTNEKLRHIIHDMNEVFERQHINERLSRVIKSVIDERGLRYGFISQASGIEYQRLMRALHGRTTLSAAELLVICKLIGIEPSSLIKELVSDD